MRSVGLFSFKHLYRFCFVRCTHLQQEQTRRLTAYLEHVPLLLARPLDLMTVNYFTPHVNKAHIDGLIGNATY